MIRLKCGHYLSPIGAQRQTPAARVIETRYTRGMRLPRHSHEFAYVVVMVDGTLRERTGGHTYDLTPGWIVFNDAAQSHENEVLAPTARCLNIELAPTLIHRLSAEGLRARESVLYTRAGSALAAVGRLYASLLDPGPDLEVDEAIVQILTSTWSSRSRAIDSTWLPRVLDLLHARFRDPPTLTQLADEAGIHHAHLCRSFHAATGCTIGQYIRALRSSFALAAITASPASLAITAARAGFADQAHMTRAFTRLYGRSPGRLRAAPPRKIRSRPVLAHELHLSIARHRPRTQG